MCEPALRRIPWAEAFSNKSARAEAPSRSRSRAAAFAKTSLTIACSPARVSGAHVCARAFAAVAPIGKTSGVSSRDESLLAASTVNGQGRRRRRAAQKTGPAVRAHFSNTQPVSAFNVETADFRSSDINFLLPRQWTDFCIERTTASRRPSGFRESLKHAFSSMPGVNVRAKRMGVHPVIVFAGSRPRPGHDGRSRILRATLA
ncbi:hypothetical protein SAMN05446927_8118 [Caballeronia arationis]|uniref:Uncharacterized protein n=1 Tax=Caballeronia arationis TaxID=1777142 RepID=A0A7Z7N6Y8_9BURK|nr:hypothetical protein SAMN05446927_8118 [Caballeronia arationis]